MVWIWQKYKNIKDNERYVSYMFQLKLLSTLELVLFQKSQKHTC